MEDCDTRILAYAKEEYTKELISILIKHFYDGIESIFDEAMERCEENQKEIFTTFQDLLKEIPKWSADMVERETNRIIECSECEYLEDLITAVFISHTKILASIRVNKKNKKINLKIPKLDYFIHKCYITMAREFWRTPYYFNRNTTNIEIQKHIKLSEEVISKSIGETIRKLLPLKHILKESLGDDYEDDDSDDSEDIDLNSKKIVNFKEPTEEVKNIIKEELNELKGGKKSEELSESLVEDFINVPTENKDTNEIDIGSIEAENVLEELEIAETKKIEDMKRAEEVREKELQEIERLKAIAEEEKKAKEMAEKERLEAEAKAKEQAEREHLEAEAKAKAQTEREHLEAEAKEQAEKEKQSLQENNELNELDLDSIVDTGSTLKVDDDFNIIDLNTLNNESNIKNTVLENFKDNTSTKKKDWAFFEDAPEIETI